MPAREITYISGTRADFGLMRRTLTAIDAHPELELDIIATGMHLSDAYGHTVDEIAAAGLRISGAVPVPLEPATGGTMARNLGTMTVAFTDLLERRQPDMVLLLGDRAEMLAGAIAGIHLGIAVGHVHGGERSGTVDESVRHAVSKLSHVHFVATAASRDRLIRLGERPDCIFVVGAPGLDGVVEAADRSRSSIAKAYGFDTATPLALMVYHPVLQEADGGGRDTEILLDCLRTSGVQTIALMPNSDAGSDRVRAALESVRNEGWIRIETHLPRRDFVSAIAAADLMIGNSSAGIIEAASFGTPVVNLGTRQNFRERNANTVDVACRPESVVEAIQSALAGGRRPPENIYGDGQTARRIVDLIHQWPFPADLMTKVNAY